MKFHYLSCRMMLGARATHTYRLFILGGDHRVASAHDLVAVDDWCAKWMMDAMSRDVSAELWLGARLVHSQRQQTSADRLALPAAIGSTSAD